MASPAIEPLLWTPLLFFRYRALFNDSLAGKSRSSPILLLTVRPHWSVELRQRAGVSAALSSPTTD